MHTLGSHADAKYDWETTEPWRGRDANERPLDGRRKGHMTIRIGNADQVICKLYRTDLVTYWPNGEIELVAYNTGSSNEFTNRLMPQGIRVDFNKGMVILNTLGWWENDKNTRVYQCNDRIKIRKTEVENLWVLAEGQKIELWKKPTVNRAKAKAALAKYDFARLQAWVTGYDAMRGGKTNEGDSPQQYLSRWNLLEFMQAGPAEWMGYAWRDRVLAGWGRDRGETTISPQIEHIRMMIYQIEDVVENVEVPYLNSYKELDSLRKTQKKYSWV